MTAFKWTLTCILAAYLLFFNFVAWPVFQFRNPTANQMSYWRDFPSIISFEKVEKYQGKES